MTLINHRKYKIFPNFFKYNCYLDILGGGILFEFRNYKICEMRYLLTNKIFINCRNFVINDLLLLQLLEIKKDFYRQL